VNTDHAKQIILGVLEDSHRVFLTNHAKERMSQREISISEINAVLKYGEIVEPPTITPNGDYKLTLESFEARRQLRVAIAIDYDDMGNKIIIITVIDV